MAAKRVALWLIIVAFMTIVVLTVVFRDRITDWLLELFWSDGPGGLPADYEGLWK